MKHIQVRFGEDVRALDPLPGAPLLDAALLTDVPISYSCRRGDCEQCGALLIDGEVTAFDPSRPLYAGESVLLCNAVAASNAVTLAIPHHSELIGIRNIRTPVKIQSLRRLSDTVVDVYFRFPPNARFNPLPGQYVRLTNQAGIVRSYSLAAMNAASQQFSIHVRKVVDGNFSNYLFNRAKVGDLLQLEGPLGHFFLRSTPVVKSVFLATGTGIAPIHAMLSTLNPESRAKLGTVSVYWGNRYRHEAYLAAELEQLAAQWSLSLRLLCSRETDGPRHVQVAMLEDSPSLRNARVYACGSAAMIHAARGAAASAGLSANDFHSDPFTAS